MQIACTKKLLDELEVKPSVAEDALPIYTWRANFIKINRRKTVVLVCEQNRYVVMLYGLKAKDFARLDEKITASIRHTLLKQQINPAIVEQYLTSAGPVSYVKNVGKTATAHLNHACRAAGYAAYKIEEVAAYNDTLGVFASHYPVGVTTSFSIPGEQMANDLKMFGNEPIFQRTALELAVTLVLDRETCSRKLIVPSSITFFQLHKILQVAFEWQDYHLFDFKVYSNNLRIYSQAMGQREDALVATLVCTEEDVEYSQNARLMGGLEISEYLPQYRHLLYTYDFGDNWEHNIEITGVLEKYEGACPVCVEGEGNAPPEDVGGIYGFENFLDILADPNHEDYDFTKTWGESQRYEDFDIKAINRKLSRALSW